MSLSILTNARAADQRSMIGYGELLLRAAQTNGFQPRELRAVSALGRLSLQGTPGKTARNIDRLLLSPLVCAGRRAGLVHVVDPGNAVYLPLIRHDASVVTVHDMIPYLARDGRLPGFQPSAGGRRLMGAILRRLASVDHIICVSEATRKDLLNYVDIAPDRVSVIPNALFQPMRPASREAQVELRRQIGLAENAPVVLHVGRNFYKNRSTVIEVFARARKDHPTAHLLLVGTLEPPLQDQIRKLGLQDGVTALDRLDARDMATLYSLASVLLFPSLYEGFGYPVAEAALCGTPVVCSDAGALPEVAGPEAVMAGPTDVEALSNGVIHFLGTARSTPAPPAILTEADWSSRHRAVYRSLGLDAPG